MLNSVLANALVGAGAADAADLPASDIPALTFDGAPLGMTVASQAPKPATEKKPVGDKKVPTTKAAKTTGPVLVSSTPAVAIKSAPALKNWEAKGGNNAPSTDHSIAWEGGAWLELPAHYRVVPINAAMGKVEVPLTSLLSLRIIGSMQLFNALDPSVPHFMRGTLKLVRDANKPAIIASATFTLGIAGDMPYLEFRHRSVTGSALTEPLSDHCVWNMRLYGTLIEIISAKAPARVREAVAA
jgi:hypothetical protein